MSDFDPLAEFLLPEDNDQSMMMHNDPLLSDGPLPIDSPRKLTSLLTYDPTIPESPDMKFARKRLGNLLTTIKHNSSEIIGVLPEDYTRGDDNDMNRPGRPPGRPRKMMRLESSTSLMDSPRKTMNRDSKIMFELRGKPFEMVAGRYEEEYSLGRAWVKGQMNTGYEPIRVKRTEFAANLAVDYLACREIHRMPRPDYSVPTVPIVPPQTDRFDESVDPSYLSNLKEEYLRHWKAVKKTWCAHQKDRNARHAKAIELIEKIFVSPEQKAAENSV